ncbi:hypothetical protein PybrP1_003863, partial [[Pythium] brassicae (nom. inval.)]
CVCKNCTLKLKFFNEKGLSVSGGPVVLTGTFCVECAYLSREQRLGRTSLDNMSEFSDIMNLVLSRVDDESSYGDELTSSSETDCWIPHDSIGSTDESVLSSSLSSTSSLDVRRAYRATVDGPRRRGAECEAAGAHSGRQHSRSLPTSKPQRWPRGREELPPDDWHHAEETKGE